MSTRESWPGFSGNIYILRIVLFLCSELLPGIVYVNGQSVLVSLRLCIMCCMYFVSYNIF
jgi:hypothetical protein